MEVSIQDINSVPVGFSRSVLTREDDGRHRWMEVSLSMHSVGPAELQLEDDYRIEIIDEKKRLVSGQWLEGSEGAMNFNVQLEHVEGNMYRYHGQVQGKSIEGDFRTKSPRGLSSNLEVAAMLAEQLAKSKSFSNSAE